MIEKHNVPILTISWLSSSYEGKSGIIETFYEPETIDELKDICIKLYSDNLMFDVIGDTSNIYFHPEYNCQYMVSTRKIKNYSIEKDTIICDCGVRVSSLSRKMIEMGFSGFEGLCDLPGTIGAAIFGNASCYGCSINKLLKSVRVLVKSEKGIEIKELLKEDLRITTRSTILKRHEMEGVILSATLELRKGNIDELKEIANKCKLDRNAHHPGPKNNLGSIFATSRKKVFTGYLLKLFSWTISVFWIITKQNNIRQKRHLLELKLLRASEIAPYLHDWNRYVWKDKKAHDVFNKYVRAYKFIYGKKSKFEIIIKK